MYWLHNSHAIFIGSVVSRAMFEALSYLIVIIVYTNRHFKKR